MTDLSFDNIVNAYAYKTDKDLKRSRFLFRTMGYPLFVPAATRITPLLIKCNVPAINKIVSNTIFKQFVGGETLEATAPLAKTLGKYDVKIVLDYGIEAKEGEENFENATEQFIKVIKYASAQPNIPFISVKVSAFASAELLKTLNEAPRLRSGVHDHEEEEAAWDRVSDRMYRICEAAAQAGIGVWVDAEESWLQDPVDRLLIEMMEEFNKERAVVYNTIQLYRHDRLNFLQLSHKIAKERGFVLGIKLVRGAYMDKERTRATQRGYPSPIQENKEDTDRDFDAAIKYCIDHLDSIAVIIASHNEASNLLATRLLQEKGLPNSHPRVHFSQLYGMSDNITFNLASAGYLVSKYLPFGPLKDVIPYLMRRAQENTSISGQTGRELNLIKREIEGRKKIV